MRRNEEVSVRTLAIIPARGGSKGVPRKNIRNLCGRPLLYYTIREAHRSALVDAAIVSTDDEQIASVARNLGADVPFLRPAALASDDARDIDYLAHALDWLEHERGWKPEAVALLLPTTPTRRAEDIDSAISMLYDTGADSIRTMVHAPHFSPYKMWSEAGEGGRVQPLFPEGYRSVPRQELPVVYMPVAAAYITRTSCIRAGSVWGSDVRMIPFPLDRFSDIDDFADWEYTELAMQKHGLI